MKKKSLTKTIFEIITLFTNELILFNSRLNCIHPESLESFFYKLEE
jgi:hypothetical protein